MSQQINNTNDQPDGSVTEAQNSALTSKNDIRITQPVKVSKAKVESKESFTERWKTNRFWLVRGTYYMFYSVWVVVMGIGTVIAWLIAMLFI